MGRCPICRSPANLERPDGGDYRRVECSRCGKFQITESALAMLPAKLRSDDLKAVARLSHSISHMAMKSDAEWPEVNSINLDEMIKRPLPPVEQQINNLLVWVARQLGDDQLGVVELPDEDDLAAVIGTVDGNRVGELISRAQRDGLIELVPDDCVMVTRHGWARLRPPVVDALPVEASLKTNDANLDGSLKAHCTRCRGNRKCWIRAAHRLDGSDGLVSWSDTYEVLECCGCEILFVRHQQWLSEWDTMDQDELGRPVMCPGIKETYYPAPTIRAKPIWSDSLADDVLRNILDELYLALNGGLKMLASVGARTLFDRAGYMLVGDPKGGFEGKLSALVDGGFISSQEKDILDAVADAGNASAHRGYTPTAERLGDIVDIIENFLHRSFVLGAAANEIRTSTPPRPKK